MKEKRLMVKRQTDYQTKNEYYSFNVVVERNEPDGHILNNNKKKKIVVAKL